MNVLYADGFRTRMSYTDIRAPKVLFNFDFKFEMQKLFLQISTFNSKLKIEK